MEAYFFAKVSLNFYPKVEGVHVSLILITSNISIILEYDAVAELVPTGISLKDLAQVIETAGFKIVKKGQWKPGALRTHNFVLATRIEVLVQIKLSNTDKIIERHGKLNQLSIMKKNPVL